MHLHINFHKLKLTWGNSYIKVPDKIAKTKKIINPKNKKAQWTNIAELHHKEIGNKPDHILNLQQYKNEYNWHSIDLPLAIQIIGKLENTNLKV